ncbi:MAG: hypothetical protein H7A47_01730 [Verrucomicrobiales bacterium]|nr:hypothetical protein [Verrucomicrobiales bacterium]
MSKNSEFELDLDLQLLPEWARQPANVNRYAKYEGRDESEPRRRRGDRPGGFRGPRPDRPDRGGERRGPGPQREGGRRQGAPRGDRFRDRGPRRPPVDEIPLPAINVTLVPEEAGVASLAHQIKLTGRAYPLFDIAALILKRAERFHIEFEVRKNEAGEVIEPLFSCSLDDSVWLSEAEVATHVLARHFDTLYQTDRVPTDPPKGTYTLVAQCPLSNVILGPPNLHDYNVKLRKLHADRFARMPFEVYKSRIRMVTDEAVVKQWIDEQSFRNEYTCLNVPEPLKLASREEVERHFRENHLPNLARNVPKVRFANTGQWPPMSRGLRVLLQRTVDEQRRFPLKVATVLSQQFARHGLQFFKVNKTVTHVCVARPHYLDLQNTLVSDGVRRIVDYIRTHEGCTRRKLLEDIAPADETAETTPATPAEPPSAAASSEAAPPQPAVAGTPAPAADEAPATAGPDTTDAATTAEASTGESAPAAPAPTPPPTAPQPTPEQAAVIADLHWLIHQGHVIEFTNGLMELAKPPRPRPEPARKKPQPPATPAEGGAAAQAPADPQTPAAPAPASEAGATPPESHPTPPEPQATSTSPAADPATTPESGAAPTPAPAAEPAATPPPETTPSVASEGDEPRQPGSDQS